MRENYLDEEDTILDADENDTAAINETAPKSSKAWRSIERYREMKELRKHVDDIFSETRLDDLEELQW